MTAALPKVEIIEQNYNDIDAATFEEVVAHIIQKRMGRPLDETNVRNMRGELVYHLQRLVVRGTLPKLPRFVVLVNFERAAVAIFTEEALVERYGSQTPVHDPLQETIEVLEHAGWFTPDRAFRRRWR